MKKRLLRIAGIAVIILMLVSIPVLASGYSATISVVNNSANTYTETPFVVTQNNSYLVSNGYISSSGLDVQVSQNGTAIPLMLTNTQTWFVLGSISANSSSSLQWSSGNSPASSMPIIIGNGGHITTDYNAALEPGANFEIDISGYFDTTAGAGKYIVEKPGAVIIVVSDTVDGTVIAEVWDGTLHHVDLTSVPSGVYNLTLSLISGTLTFTVGSYSDVCPDTIGTVTPGVDDWTWDDGNVMPYINYISYSN